MLIITKLRRPRVADDFVVRHRLVERLEQGRSRKLTLISAPAGYGKSSLAAAWLESAHHLSVWYSIDRSDADLIQFVEYLAAGITDRIPGSCPRSTALLQAAEPPPLSAVTAGLINDLAEIDAPLVITLDDYHLVDGSEAAKVVETLLEYLPKQVHFVLIARQDPNLPLTQLRARHEMLEVRSTDLRFTQSETSTFLAGAIGSPLPEETLHLLSEKTEGWVVGLRLAALSLRSSREVAEFSERMNTAQGGLVVDYLVSEVLAHTTSEMRRFLLKTSICDRFCAQLCDTVLDNADPLVKAESHIDSLVRTNLFLVSLDGTGEWWRYHHLFQDLLQHRLRVQYSGEEIAALHLRASRWFADHGLLDEAFRHAVSAGDLDAGADLIEQHRSAVMNADKWHSVEVWLGQLPESIKQQRPALVMTQAWIAYFHHSLQAIPPLMERIETLLGEHDHDPLRGEADFFRALALFWQGDSERCKALLSRALERIPLSNHQARGEAELYYGLARQMSGQAGVAVKAINQALYSGERQEPIYTTRLLASLIFIHFLSGSLPEALQVALRARKSATAIGNAYVEAWTWYLEGYIHFFRYELEAAASCFEQATQRRYVLHVRAAIDGLIGQVFTYQYLGQAEAAQESLALLFDFVQEMNELAYVILAESCKARLSILQDAATSSRRWLQTADQMVDVGTMFYWLEIPRITACRILAAQDSDADLRKSLETLAAYFQENQAVHNVRQMIDIAALQAVLFAKMGKTDEAIAMLKRALSLAEPGGWVQPFVELGAPMATLLRDLQRQRYVDPFVAQILAAFPTSKSVQPPAPSPLLPEPLTARELEVLVLLSQRYRDKEIAAQLFISPATVKRHASNVYQKLQVNNRRQAVARASDWGLLPQER